MKNGRGPQGLAPVSFWAAKYQKIEKSAENSLENTK